MSVVGNEGRGNAEALARARAETSARKYRDAVAALTRASLDQQPLSVAAIAEAAGVSRQFLYSRSDLMDRIRRHQQRNPATVTERVKAARSADLINALSSIRKLKSEVRDLQLKLDAGLAAQIELRDEQRLRVLYEQRGHEVDRLVARNADLQRTVRQLEETVRGLEDDLAVERMALRQLSERPGNVTDIRLGN